VTNAYRENAPPPVEPLEVVGDPFWQQCIRCERPIIDNDLNGASGYCGRCDLQVLCGVPASFLDVFYRAFARLVLGAPQ
jgi:hypothetical protein